MTVDTKYINAIKKDIEHTLGRVLHTPADFVFASESIQEKTKEYISRTTLMRVWGYVNEPCNSRVTTFNIMSRFLNYLDFTLYCKHIDNIVDTESFIIQSEFISPKDLKVNECVEFTWNPGRRCLVKFLGDQIFQILQVDNSKLQVGDIFTCHFFILHQPLHLFEMRNGEDVTKTYVAGNKSGLTSLKKFGV